jgi:hypothetical protein
MAELSDLVTRTLEKVGIQSGFETVSADDQEKALTSLRSAHSELSTENLLRWSVNDIPTELEEPYVMMAAWYAGPDFGFPVDIAVHELGLRQIRKYAMTPKASTPVEAEYF